MSVIKEYTELTTFTSDDGKRSATVIRELGTKRFIVRMKGDAGSYFTASTENIEAAENIAEDWIHE